jgi:phage protein D
VETIRKPVFKIIYDGKDITADVTDHVLSISYTDNDEKEADEIEITLEDVDALWRNSWYPQKGSTLKVAIGYDDGITVDCGTFDIDEITLSGPPDVIAIRGIAAGFKKSMRTKKSKAFENQTLRQIAESIARDNSLTLVGTIANIKFARVTQDREKDLSFLARIASEYGYLFSVRSNQLIFTSQVEIEGGQPVLSIDRAELRSYSIKDKTSETYKDAQVKYHNPDDGKVKEAKVDTVSNADGVTYKQISSEDTLEVRTKAETPAQANARAR